MNSAVKYKPNAAQQRCIKALFVLAGNEATGLPPSAVARAIKTSDNRIFHDLRNLAHAGVAERMDSGNWRLSPRLVQVAVALQVGLARLNTQVGEIENRYTRLPR